MFSLIISIISIALVAALAAATVYFGGAAFNKGGAGADASAFINAGQQIAGAFTIAETDGENIETVAGLSPNYLAQVPTFKGEALVLSGTTGYITLEDVKVSDNICDEINDRAVGKGGVAPTTVSGLYGCVKGADDALNNAFYKVTVDTTPAVSP